MLHYFSLVNNDCMLNTATIIDNMSQNHQNGVSVCIQFVVLLVLQLQPVRTGQPGQGLCPTGEILRGEIFYVQARGGAGLEELQF